MGFSICASYVYGGIYLYVENILEISQEHSRDRGDAIKYKN